MTDEEMAEAYKESKRHKCFRADVTEIKIIYDTYLESLKQAYLAGLKAGRPKWHKPSEKLPEECTTVLACEFNNEEPSLYRFVISDQWEWLPRRIAVLNNAEISKWCEIPKYTEE